LDSSAAVERPLEQRRIGYVPQDYALFPHLSVRQNLEFAAFSPKHAAPAAQRRARVQSLSEKFSLTALLERAPATLSGGERQRVALARALCVQPRALLLDEPLAALDRHAVDEVRRTLAQHLRALSLPTLLVSHAAADLRTFGERIAVIEHGRIIQQGNFEQLRQNPGSPFVAQLVAG
jgi:molybdate transport system ATP-binding protein